MRTHALLGLAAVCLAPLATAASAAEVAAQATEPLEVVTTLGVLADVAREVGGERVHVRALADARQDPHYVEPRPTLMQLARDADLFVEVGLQLELWAEKVVAGSGNPAIQSGQPGRVIASTGIQTLELPQVLSREWGDVHPYGNPHVWLDPLNVKAIAANIEQGLAAVDTAHAAEYHARLVDYQQRIDRALFGERLVDEIGGEKLARLARQGRLSDYLEKHELGDALGGWLARAAPLAGRPVITYHKTMAYASERFGFRVPIEIEEKPGIQPSARHRDQVLELMKAQGVRSILLEIFYERTAADWLASKGGAKVIVRPIDVGAEGGAGTYFELIDGLLDELLRSETGS